MDCKELQKKFIPFIDDQLSIDDLDAFLSHLDSCQECREEYDIYYTMIMGCRYLDETVNSTEFHIDSEEKLRSAADYLFEFRILHMEKVLLLVVMCLGMILIS